MIAFAGDAFLQCPLTFDHDAFQTAVRELDTDTIPRPGTDIATAIRLAIDALKSQANNLKFLILVTDGEDLEGHVLDAAREAAQSGLKIYTVGVGTPAGGLIPERDDAARSSITTTKAGRSSNRNSMRGRSAKSRTSRAVPTSHWVSAAKVSRRFTITISPPCPGNCWRNAAKKSASNDLSGRWASLFYF